MMPMVVAILERRAVAARTVGHCLPQPGLSAIAPAPREHHERHDRDVIQTDKPPFIENRKRPADDVVKGRLTVSSSTGPTEDDAKLNGENPRCGCPRGD